jgi:hypothetical protein
MSKRIRARSVTEPEILRGDGLAELPLELPRKGLADKPPHRIARRHSPDFAVWFAQGGELGHAHSIGDATRKVAAGHLLGGPGQELQCRFVFKA